MPLRPPLVAGHFYPAAPAALAGEIQAFLASQSRRPGKVSYRETPRQDTPQQDTPHRETPQQDAGQQDAGQQDTGQPSPCPALLALLPHAGYVYCASVMAATLASIALPSRLVLLGPNHSGLGAPLAVWPEGAWQTPLGETPVDREMVGELLRAPLPGTAYSADVLAHEREHSLEVLLPFLQSLVPGLRICPVCVSCPPGDLEAAGLALAEAIRKQGAGGDEVGIIVSSDMNHYADHERTLRLDALALEAFLALDPVRLFNTVVERRISMCGVLPATLALFACRALGADRASLVRHTTSAEASGDTERVVGYAGAYIPRPRS